jgi:hypothetical protein
VAWQGLAFDQVLRMPMTGFPAHPPAFVEIETTASLLLLAAEYQGDRDLTLRTAWRDLHRSALRLS